MASTIKEQFQIPKRYNTWAIGLMVVGLISVIALFITHGSKSGLDDQGHEINTRFCASLLQNSVYFLLITNAAMFFICATTLAWGGWQMSFRRVTEAISTCVPVIGVIALVILLVLILLVLILLWVWITWLTFLVLLTPSAWPTISLRCRSRRRALSV